MKQNKKFSRQSISNKIYFLKTKGESLKIKQWFLRYYIKSPATNKKIN